MDLRTSLIVLFACVGLGTFTGCSGKEEPKEKPPVVQEMNIVKPSDDASDEAPKN